jgi:multicomponent Na+:H+ antiporter subunit G
MTPVEVVSGALLVVGGVLSAVAGLGVVRFPDVLSRMHAATKPATLGLLAVALGAMLRLPSLPDLTKVVLIVALQFLTAPVGAHLIGRAVRPRFPGDEGEPPSDPGSVTSPGG